MKNPLIKKLKIKEKLLMGAGPVPIPKSVKDKSGLVINHLGKEMNKITDEIIDMGKYLFQTNSNKIFAISGPSSGAMEMAIVNLIEKEDSVLCLEHGKFGSRFKEILTKINANVDSIISEGKPISPKEVVAKLKEKNYKAITMVQGETSCGLKNIYVKEISEIAKQYGLIVIVDAVCTLTTMPLKMDEWNIDAVVTGGQKGLSSISGVSLIAFSSSAWEIVKKRNNITHWCYDANKAYDFWIKKSYHYTAPCGLLALHEAMRLICEEGLEKRFQRHEECSLRLQKELEKIGLELYMDKTNRLNSVIAIKTPKFCSSKEILQIMDEYYNIQLSGSFGLDIFRIGQMGEQCQLHYIKKTVYALNKTLEKLKNEN